MGLTKQNFYTKPEESKKPEINLTTSWDDGGKGDLRIAELLKKNKLTGTFYIAVDYIGKDGYMTWDDIKQLDKEGFKIGSHTLTHPMDLKTLYDEELFTEVQTSKDLIETALGHNIESFCYPRGRTDERVKQKVMEAGYVEARGTGKPGITTIDDKFYLPGTIHIFQRPEYEGKPIITFAREVFEKLEKEGGYCNIWGHSVEIEKNNLWSVLENILEDAGRIANG